MSKLIKAPPTQIAVWGGALARSTGLDGKWLAIPTGHQPAIPTFGTGSDPATSYTLSLTADDLLSVMWTPLHTIHITGCKIFYGQGGGNNTTHSACLMRYDQDTDGDLSNGHQIGAVTTSVSSHDYSHIGGISVAIDTDNKVAIVPLTDRQILIAMLFCHDNINASVTGKCVIEYK